MTELHPWFLIYCTQVAQSNTAFLLENYEDQLFPELTDSNYRAFHQWTRSADQGYSLSKIRLGDYNYYGIGRPVDYQSAVNEYREAAKAQDPQAKFNMGYMYERGLGVAKVIVCISNISNRLSRAYFRISHSRNVTMMSV